MRKMLMLTAGILLLAGLASAVTAQVDPGLRVYLYDRDLRVGEVFVPERAPGASHYEEHWVLYKNYEYPGPNNLRGLVIKAESSETPYRNADDFFARVPFRKGSKYIHVTATESPVKAPIAR
jgi:hypothetical protein